jgi:3-dehydroquinate synthase
MTHQPVGLDAGAALRIRSRVRDYDVEFDDSGGWAQALAGIDRAFVIVDENVLRLHGDGVLAPFGSGPIAVLTATEDHKTFEAVARLCDQAIERSAKRSVVLVSIGGGITQDVTGFMASVLYRGVGWVYVPTTLLAMGDSCIGGKTSLNFGSRKNLLGTIYPPERIIIHTPFVSTLSGSDFASGMGEIVKLHMFGGPGAVEDVREALPKAMVREPETVRRAIRTSLEIKRVFIEEDELDRGRRNLLNYGHCFGHALESATNFAIPHGLAVVIGMRLADLVARRRGMLSEGEATDRCLALYLPVVNAWPRLDAAMRDAVVGAMAYDKKRTGSGLAVVVLGDRLTPAQLADVTVDEAHAALAGLHEPLPT